jgi:hypothetical protein
VAAAVSTGHPSALMPLQHQHRRPEQASPGCVAHRLLQCSHDPAYIQLRCACANVTSASCSAGLDSSIALAGAPRTCQHMRMCQSLARNSCINSACVTCITAAPLQAAQQALGEGPLAQGITNVLGGFLGPAGYSGRLNVRQCMLHGLFFWGGGLQWGRAWGESGILWGKACLGMSVGRGRWRAGFCKSQQWFSGGAHHSTALHVQPTAHVPAAHQHQSLHGKRR